MVCFNCYSPHGVWVFREWTLHHHPMYSVFKEEEEEVSIIETIKEIISAENIGSKPEIDTGYEAILAGKRFVSKRKLTTIERSKSNMSFVFTVWPTGWEKDVGNERYYHWTKQNMAMMGLYMLREDRDVLPEWAEDKYQKYQVMWAKSRRSRKRKKRTTASRIMSNVAKMLNEQSTTPIQWGRNVDIIEEDLDEIVL